jgi:glutathione S-transferase
MHTLYYSPGACSLAPHILLHELALPHRLERTFTGDEEHCQPAYLAVNPVGKLPTLVRQDGAALTEVVAILGYLARIGGAADLVPADPWARAQLDSAMAFIASELHPAYALAIRPDRVLRDAATSTLEDARGRGRRRFVDNLRHLESRFAGPYLTGEAFSIADPYVFVMVIWARFLGVELTPLPKLRAALTTLAARPAVQAALRAEGLVDEAGRPTPPARV